MARVNTNVLITEAKICPFVNQKHQGCAHTFHLTQIDHAFDYCFGNPKACSQYHVLNQQRREPREPVSITIHGRKSLSTTP